MEQLEQLLERVKAAKGPDRELSRDIFEAVTGECVHRKYSRQCVGENDDYELVCDDCHTETWGENLKWVELTASIDAALSLVERVLPGWIIRVVTGDPTCSEKSPYRECETILRPYLHNDEGWAIGEKVGHAATPPLAILAALLTALIAQKQAVAQEG